MHVNGQSQIQVLLRAIIVLVSMFQCSMPVIVNKYFRSAHESIYRLMLHVDANLTSEQRYRVQIHPLIQYYW